LGFCRDVALQYDYDVCISCLRDYPVNVAKFSEGNPLIHQFPKMLKIGTKTKMTDLMEITVNGKVGNEVHTFRVESMEPCPNNEGKIRLNIANSESSIIVEPERVMGINSVLNF